jgi:hypothetical protein
LLDPGVIDPGVIAPGAVPGGVVIGGAPLLEPLIPAAGAETEGLLMLPVPSPSPDPSLQAASAHNSTPAVPAFHNERRPTIVHLVLTHRTAHPHADPVPR